jgi:hypothetical protein
VNEWITQIDRPLGTVNLKMQKLNLKMQNCGIRHRRMVGFIVFLASQNLLSNKHLR